MDTKVAALWLATWIRIPEVLGSKLGTGTDFRCYDWSYLSSVLPAKMQGK